MKKFLVIYYSSPDSMKHMKTVSPEQKAKGMKIWLAWRDKMGDNLIDFGAPLIGGLQVKVDGSSTTSQKEVSGYSILQAASIEEAKKMLIDHPHTSGNSGHSIELHECVVL